MGDSDMRADGPTFELDPEQSSTWEELNSRPAQHLPSVTTLHARIAPWQQGDDAPADPAAGARTGSTHLPAFGTGVWRVIARSEVYLFDLDQGRYMRTPGDGQTFEYDGRWCRITRISPLPSVGGKFLVRFDDPDIPGLSEQ